MTRPPPRQTDTRPRARLAEISARAHLSDIAAGGFLALDLIGRIAALTVLIFSGGLAAGLDLALPLSLSAVALSTLLLVWRGGIAISAAALQDVPIAILVPTLASLVAVWAVPAETRVANALAILGATSLVLGVCLWLLGRFRAASLVRVLPFPVMAGFLASSGYLMIATALVRGAGLEGSLWTPASLLTSANLTVVLALVLALAVALLQGAGRGLWTPLLLVAVIGGFYLWAWSANLRPEDLRALALLPAAPALGTQAVALSPGLVAQVDPAILWAALPTILTAAMVGIVAYLLTLSGVELATDSDIDLNAELRLTGAGNVVTAALGASPCYLSASSTLLGQRLGVRHRAGPATLAAVCGLGVFFAADLVPLIPRFVLAGLVLATGISLVQRWILAQARAMPLIDWGVVVAIVAVTAVLGILPAILMGLVIATGIFSWRYGRLTVFRRASDLGRLRSAVDRSPLAGQVLDRYGALTQVMVLRGFLFFGSIEQLILRARGLLAQSPAPLHIVVDFADVLGMDPTACSAMGKLSRMCAGRGTGLILTALRPDLRRALERADLQFAPDAPPDATGSAPDAAPDAALIQTHPDLDSALEACEEVILGQHLTTAAGDGLAAVVLAMVPDPEALARLMGHMRRLDLEPGAVLIRQGSAADEMFFIESGRVSVMVQGPEGPQRVRSMGAGALVGEIAHYTGAPRSADVVVDRAAVVHVLSADTLRALEHKDPKLMVFYHRLVATMLADKVVRTTRALTAK